MESDLLISLVKKSKASVNVTVNLHKDYYETVEQHMQSLVATEQADMEDFHDVLEEMIKKDTIIEIQFYPDTPIGSYTVYHHDMMEALKKCHAILE